MMKRKSKVLFSVFMLLVVLSLCVLPAFADSYTNIQFFPETTESTRLSNFPNNIGYYLTQTDSDFYQCVTESGLDYQNYISSYGCVFMANHLSNYDDSFYNDGFDYFGAFSYGALCMTYTDLSTSESSTIYRTGVISYQGGGYDTWSMTAGNLYIIADCIDGYIGNMQYRIGTGPFHDMDDITICLFLYPQNADYNTFTQYGIFGGGRYMYLNQAYEEVDIRQAGYQEGYDAGSNVSDTWYDLIFDTISAPINVFKDMFNFEIFGVNVSVFVISLLTIGFIVLIVKKVV